MEFQYWNVLVVDDEPDVHSVTRLALKRMEVYGAPIKLHEVSSKAAAIEWLKTSPDANFVHVAIIDVVMESDTAGLELCKFIREEMKNSRVSIVLRTGQAGKAPERGVVDDFDITSYLAKTEATEERLYSLIKCSVKEAYSAYMLGRPDRLVRTIENRLSTVAEFKESYAKIAAYAKKNPSLDVSYGVLWGDNNDHVGAGIFEDRAQTIEIRDRLLRAAKSDGFGNMVAIEADPSGQKLTPKRYVGLYSIPASGKIFPTQDHLWTTSQPKMPMFESEARRSLYLSLRLMYTLAGRLEKNG